MSEPKKKARKGRAVLRDRLFHESLRIEPYTNGNFLEATGYLQVKLTPAVARKLIRELTPYLEWLPPGTSRRRPPVEKPDAHSDCPYPGQMN